MQTLFSIMFTFHFVRLRWRVLLPRLSWIIVVSLFGPVPARAGSATIRGADEDPNGLEVRTRGGLPPSENLLFNGWGMTPVGEQLRVFDMPLKLVVAPDRKRLFAVHGGFTQHGVTIVDIASHRPTQFL